MKKRNITVAVSLMLTITTLSFFSTINQTGTSALSISQTTGKVIAVKFDGIDGESVFIETVGWSDVISYSWGAHRPDAGATGASRRRASAILEDFVLVKNIDKSTPKIQEKMLRGEVIPKVEIVEYLNGVQYWKYDLTNVQITSFVVAGSSDFEGADLEQITLNYEEIKYTYTEREADGKAKGNVEFEWKVEEGES
ncbi:MAG: type VI secretion system tube protein Hcp [Candidatus Heimdallarchaeota archaeon]|nr:type VI secretion system tube protein Hcp [Candidatus Heimdallarchaeota archaeon]